MRWFYRCCGIVLSLVVVVLWFPPPVLSHAKVLSATPAIGSTIKQAPATVTVTVSENLDPDPRKSNLFVYGPDGEMVSQSDAQIPLNNPQQMTVALTSQGEGVYVVQWNTASALDGDPSQGAFVFTVRASSAGSATPTPSQETPSATPSRATGEGMLPLWVAIVGSLLTLLVGLVVGFGLGRRGGRLKRGV